MAILPSPGSHSNPLHYSINSIHRPIVHIMGNMVNRRCIALPFSFMFSGSGHVFPDPFMFSGSGHVYRIRSFSESGHVFRIWSCFPDPVMFSESGHVFRIQSCFPDLVMFSESGHVFPNRSCFKNPVMFSRSGHVFGTNLEKNLVWSLSILMLEKTDPNKIIRIRIRIWMLSLK